LTANDLEKFLSLCVIRHWLWTMFQELTAVKGHLW